MAPSKKNVALLSSGEPANSSMLKGPLPCCDTELVHDVGGLQHADLEVVECRVVVHVFGAADQPVVADHRDLRVRRALQDVGQR